MALVKNLSDSNNFCFQKCPILLSFLINLSRSVFHNMGSLNTIFPLLIFFYSKDSTFDVG